MYRLVIKRRGGDVYSLRSYTLEEARERKSIYNETHNQGCKIVKEAYVYGEESYQEIF